MTSLPIISTDSSRSSSFSGLGWSGDSAGLSFDLSDVKQKLNDLSRPLFVIKQAQGLAVVNHGELSSDANLPEVLGFTPALLPETLGDPDFKKTYRTRYACYAGSMANAISSIEMVIALGKQGMLGSYGAGGMSPARIEEAIHQVQAALPEGPYAFNLLNSPNEPAMEKRTASIYLQNGVHTIEASAYLSMTAALVWYRVSGLSLGPDGQVLIANHIIAKVSRKEIAKRFMEPAPADILNQLLSENKITQEQITLASRVPMADDITVEADSGGHTDNRPLISLIPAMVALRNSLQEKYAYTVPVRIGAGGGIATPASALAAFTMGAAYIVTGSVNQSCLESGASEHTRNLLSQAEMTDMTMAPAGDMFEMGVKVQVLKRGTLFAMRAQKLYDLYARYETWEEIPLKEREKLETSVFKRTFNDIWQECQRFFGERDPRQVERGNQNPKDKMALVFRWYLGLSSRWSNTGEKGREMDYQVWCGPAMGAFNDWVRGAYLADIQHRRVADVTLHILTGCAYLQRLRFLQAQGLRFSPLLDNYLPEKPIIG